MGGFAFWIFEDRKHPGRVALCFVGFFVAMVWILMIVNEVVGVLQVSRLLRQARGNVANSSRHSDTFSACRTPFLV